MEEKSINSQSLPALPAAQCETRTGHIDLVDLQRRLVIVALALLILFLAFQVCAFFADIIRILAISVLISYLFINVVDFMERLLRSRGAAILVVYAMLAVVTVISLVLIIPSIFYQINQLLQSVFDRFPDAIQYLTSALHPLEARLHAAQINIRSVDILTTIAANAPKPEPGMILNRVADLTMSTMTWLLYTISIMVVSFYFLLEGHRIRDQVLRLFPRKYRASLQLAAADMDKSLQAFFRGQVVLALLAGIIMLGVYSALGVEYALLLSVFLAVWEIVPVIGPPIGFAPAVVTVALHGMNFPGNRFIQILALILIFNVMQQIKDNVVAPRYIGNVIGIHPILIFVAIMIGARIDGMLGIIVALPAACVVNVLINHLPLKEADEAMLLATAGAGQEPAGAAQLETEARSDAG